MRVLVTGATGFIGRTLVPHLLKQPDLHLTLLLREAYGNPQCLPPHLAASRADYEAVYADLRNYRLTARALRQAAPDAVIHLAAVGATDPFLSIATALAHNLTGTINLARAAFEASGSARQLIVARTPGEQSTMNVYAASKAAAWSFCQMFSRTHGWAIHGAMIFQAYGPHQPAHALIPAAMRAALAGEDFPMTAGTQERDWVYVRDVAAGLCAMLGRPLRAGETLDLGTGQLTSVADVVRRVYGLVHARLGNGVGRPLIGALPSRPGEDRQQVADVRQTRERLGWETAVSLEAGLDAYLSSRLRRETDA